MEFPIRINKYLAHKGYATRRDADSLIERGKVLVNGEPALIGQKILADDHVEVTASKSRHTYILYYKPRGIITHSPAPHETDIVTKIREDHGVTGVFPVGRLDKDSEGLIMLTDDGRITERILNPDRAHEREYLVNVDKPITKPFLQKIERGINIEGYMTKPAKTENRRNKKQFVLILTEGKKHQVRRMCAALGYQVTSLKRTRILDFSLGTQTPGSLYTLNKKETKHLMEMLGIR